MFEKIVTLIFNKFLSKYIHNLEKKNLKIGILETHVKLRNLEIKSDALYDLGIPITIKTGYIGSIVLDLKWSRNQLLVICIDDIFLQLEPLYQGPFNLEKENKFLKAFKLKCLANVDRYFVTEESEENEKRTNQDIETNNIVDRFLIKLFKNIKININNIHINYEDILSLPDYNLSLGILGESFILENSTSVWYIDKKPKDKHTKYKIGKIKSIFVYWNVMEKRHSRRDIFDKISQVLSWRKWMKDTLHFALNSSSPKNPTINDDSTQNSNTPSTHRKMQFVVQNFNFNLLLALNKRNSLSYENDLTLDHIPKTNDLEPKITLEINFDPVTIKITQEQAISLRYLCGLYARMLVNLPYRKYVIKVVLEEKIRPYSWEYIKHYRFKYRRYKSLMYRMYHISHSTWEKLEVQDLETALNVTSILLAREEAKIDYASKFPTSEKLKSCYLCREWWYTFPFNHLYPNNSFQSNTLLLTLEPKGPNIHYSEEDCFFPLFNLSKQDLVDIYRFLLGTTDATNYYSSSFSSVKRPKNYGLVEIVNEQTSHGSAIGFGPCQSIVLNRNCDHHLAIHFPYIRIIYSFVSHNGTENSLLFNIVQFNLEFSHRWQNHALVLDLTLRTMNLQLKVKEGTQIFQIIHPKHKVAIDPPSNNIFALQLETFPVYDGRLLFTLYVLLEPLDVYVNQEVLDIFSGLLIQGRKKEKHIINTLLKLLLMATKICYNALSKTYRSRYSIMLKGDINLPHANLEFLRNERENDMNLIVNMGRIKLDTHLPSNNDIGNIDKYYRDLIDEDTTNNEKNLYETLYIKFQDFKFSYRILPLTEDWFHIFPNCLDFSVKINNLLETLFSTKIPKVKMETSILPFNIHISNTMIKYILSLIEVEYVSNLFYYLLHLLALNFDKSPKDILDVIYIDLFPQSLTNYYQPTRNYLSEKCSCHHDLKNSNKKITNDVIDYLKVNRGKRDMNDDILTEVLRDYEKVHDFLRSLASYYTFTVVFKEISLKYLIDSFHNEHPANKDLIIIREHQPQNFISAYTINMRNLEFISKSLAYTFEYYHLLQFDLQSLSVVDEITPLLKNAINVFTSSPFSLEQKLILFESHSTKPFMSAILMFKEKELSSELINTPSLKYLCDGYSRSSLPLKCDKYYYRIINNIKSLQNMAHFHVNSLQLRISEMSVINLCRVLKISSTEYIKTPSKSAHLRVNHHAPIKACYRTLTTEFRERFDSFTLLVNVKKFRADFMKENEFHSHTITHCKNHNILTKFIYTFDASNFEFCLTAFLNPLLYDLTNNVKRHTASLPYIHNQFKRTIKLANILSRILFKIGLQRFKIFTKDLNTFDKGPLREIIIFDTWTFSPPIYLVNIFYDSKSKNFINNFGSFEFLLNPDLYQSFIYFCEDNYIRALMLLILGVSGRYCGILLNVLILDFDISQVFNFTIQRGMLIFLSQDTFLDQSQALEIYWHKVYCMDLQHSIEQIHYLDLANFSKASSKSSILKIDELAVKTATYQDYAFKNYNLISTYLFLEIQTLPVYLNYFEIGSTGKAKDVIYAKVFFTSMALNINIRSLMLLLRFISYLFNLTDYYKSGKYSSLYLKAPIPSFHFTITKNINLKVICNQLQGYFSRLNDQSHSEMIHLVDYFKFEVNTLSLNYDLYRASSLIELKFESLDLYIKNDSNTVRDDLRYAKLLNISCPNNKKAHSFQTRVTHVGGKIILKATVNVVAFKVTPASVRTLKKLLPCLLNDAFSLNLIDEFSHVILFLTGVLKHVTADFFLNLCNQISIYYGENNDGKRFTLGNSVILLFHWPLAKSCGLRFDILDIYLLCSSLDSSSGHDDRRIVVHPFSLKLGIFGSSVSFIKKIIISQLCVHIFPDIFKGFFTMYHDYSFLFFEGKNEQLWCNNFSREFPFDSLYQCMDMSAMSIAGLQKYDAHDNNENLIKIMNGIRTYFFTLPIKSFEVKLDINNMNFFLEDGSSYPLPYIAIKSTLKSYLTFDEKFIISFNLNLKSFSLNINDTSWQPFIEPNSEDLQPGVFWNVYGFMIIDCYGIFVNNQYPYGDVPQNEDLIDIWYFRKLISDLKAKFLTGNSKGNQVLPDPRVIKNKITLIVCIDNQASINVTLDLIVILNQMIQNILNPWPSIPSIILKNNSGLKIGKISPFKILKEGIEHMADSSVYHLEPIYLLSHNNEDANFRDNFQSTISSTNCSILTCAVKKNSRFPGAVSNKNIKPGFNLYISLESGAGQHPLNIPLLKLNSLIRYDIPDGEATRDYNLYSYSRVHKGKYIVTLFSGHRLVNATTNLNLKIMVVTNPKCLKSRFLLRYVHTLKPGSSFDIPLSLLIDDEKLLVKPFFSKCRSDFTLLSVDRSILQKVVKEGGQIFEFKNRLINYEVSGLTPLYLKLEKDLILPDYDYNFISDNPIERYAFKTPLIIYNYLPLDITLSFSQPKLFKIIKPTEYIIQSQGQLSIYEIDPLTQDLSLKVGVKDYLGHDWEFNFTPGYELKQVPYIINFFPTTDHQCSSKSLSVRIKKNSPPVRSSYSLHFYSPCYLANHTESPILPYKDGKIVSENHDYLKSYTKFFLMDADLSLKFDNFRLALFPYFARDSVIYNSDPFSLINTENNFSLDFHAAKTVEEIESLRIPESVQLFVYLERTINIPSYIIVHIYPKCMIENTTDYDLTLLPSRDSRIISGKRLVQFPVIDYDDSFSIKIGPNKSHAYFPKDSKCNTLVLVKINDNRIPKANILFIKTEEFLETILVIPTFDSKEIYICLKSYPFEFNRLIKFQKFFNKDIPLLLINLCPHLSIIIKQKNAKNDNSLILNPNQYMYYAWEDMSLDKSLVWDLVISREQSDEHTSPTINVDENQSYGNCLFLKSPFAHPSSKTTFATQSSTSNLLCSHNNEEFIDGIANINDVNTNEISNSFYQNLSLNALVIHYSLILPQGNDIHSDDFIYNKVYWASFSSSSSQKIVLFTDKSSLAKYYGTSRRTLLVPSFEITLVQLKNLGISVIGPSSEELSYITILPNIKENAKCFDEKEFSYAINFSYNRKCCLQCIINNLQVDNQIINSIYPCVLYPSSTLDLTSNYSDPTPFIKIKLDFELPDNYNSTKIIFLDIMLRPFDINIDRGFLFVAWAYYHLIEKYYRKVITTSDIKKILKTSLKIEHLYIHPLNVNICFTLRGETNIPFLHKNASSNEIIDFCLDFFGSSFVDISNVDVNYSKLTIKFSEQNITELISSIFNHYFYQSLWQSYIFVLGLDILGNPYTLLKDISKGIIDLRGNLRGNSDFTLKLCDQIRKQKITQILKKLKCSNELLELEQLKPHMGNIRFNLVNRWDFMQKIMIFLLRIAGILLGPILAISENLAETLAILSLDNTYQLSRKTLINSSSHSIRQNICKFLRLSFYGTYSGLKNVINILNPAHINPADIQNFNSNELFNLMHIKSSNLNIPLYLSSSCDNLSLNKDETFSLNLLTIYAKNKHFKRSPINLGDNSMKTYANPIPNRRYSDGNLNISQCLIPLHRRSEQTSKRIMWFRNFHYRLGQALFNGLVIKSIISFLDALSFIAYTTRHAVNVGEPLIKRLRYPRASNPVLGVPSYVGSQALGYSAFIESFGHTVGIVQNCFPILPPSKKSKKVNARQIAHIDFEFRKIKVKDIYCHQNLIYFLYSLVGHDINEWHDMEKMIREPAKTKKFLEINKEDHLLILTTQHILYITKNKIWGYWQIKWADQLMHIKNIILDQPNKIIHYTAKKLIEIDEMNAKTIDRNILIPDPKDFTLIFNFIKAFG
ncbi:unnamed protein product [Gordionus sp. m RMFG-2023]